MLRNVLPVIHAKLSPTPATINPTTIVTPAVHGLAARFADVRVVRLDLLPLARTRLAFMLVVFNSLRVGRTAFGTEFGVLRSFSVLNDFYCHFILAPYAIGLVVQ